MKVVYFLPTSLSVLVLFSFTPHMSEGASSLGGIGMPFDISTLPPLEQLRNGMPVEKIICSSGLHLLIKAEDRSPACVRLDTLVSLVERGWALEPTKKTTVYFIKPNSTGHMLVEYRSSEGVQESIVPRLYSDSAYPAYSPYLTVSVNPDTIYGNTNTTVLYTITAKEDARGMYWLTLGNCQFIPISVGLNSSQITNVNLHPSMFEWKCPGSLFNYEIILVDNMDTEYK
ncbi:MAG TPA: hypothetical protein VJ771_06045 [Candidatus Nitrosotalea sp.]|nr:hypothetical protein [Candidatus Nitrosotalea sp.]